MQKSAPNIKTISSILGSVLLVAIVILFTSDAVAQTKVPQISLSLGGGDQNGQLASAVKVFLFITVISLGPAILLTMTSFPRIVIVLSFLRQAIGIHQSPPNQVIVGLSLFLTFFVMSPVIKEVHSNSISPLLENKINHEVAIQRATDPIKKFMFKQTRLADLELMYEISKDPKPKDMEELSMTVLIPAFILSELRSAFEIAFLLYLPFILIDIVIAMILLSMGMMMLPPIILSLPFKLMLFVLVDGWNLVVGSLVRSFQ